MPSARIGKGFKGRPGRTVITEGLLQASDFSYLGTYRMPENFTLAAYGGGAFRKVGGAARIFAYAGKGTFNAKGTITSAASATTFTANITFGLYNVMDSFANADSNNPSPHIINVYNPASDDPVEVRTITNRTGSAGNYTFTVDPPLSTTPSAGWVIYRPDDPIIEVELPAAAPGANYLTAPRATIVARYMDPYRGKKHSFNESSPGSGVWTYDSAANAPFHYYPATLFWHESEQKLYWSFYATYDSSPAWCLGASELGAPSGGSIDNGTVTAYGPWRTVHIDRLSDTYYGPARMGIFSLKPDGSMIGHAITRSLVASGCWGPTCWGRAVGFPNQLDAGGPGAANDITVTDRYLEYYYPSLGGAMHFEQGKYIAKDGSYVNAITSYQHTKPTGYGQIFEQDYDTPRSVVNPAENGGIASWNSATDSQQGLLWFDDGTKKALITGGLLSISSDTDPNSASASHVFYRNDAQYSIGYDPATLIGTFIAGETMEGVTSGALMNVTPNIDYALHKIQGAFTDGNIPSAVQNWQIGELIRGQQSLATAEVNRIQRNIQCEHGHWKEITGDQSTHQTTTFMLFDPDRLETNKSGATVDYETTAYEVIDLIAAFPNLRVSQASSGTGGSLAIAGYDPDTRRLYCVALGANNEISDQSTQTLIHVFEIA